MRVLVTRAAERAQPLVAALRNAGFEPVECPLIETEPIDDGPIDVRDYDWVIVTSAAGVEQLARRHAGELPRVAAIGQATADALRQHGLPVDFVPQTSTQEGLVEEFPRPVGRALFVGAEAARDVIASELPAEARVVYRTRKLRPDPPPQADVALVASPSAAEAFAELSAGIPVVTIGPQTTEAALGVGLDVIAEADTPDTDALVNALRDATT
jgi:uroporphyrinogen-III synthase